MKTIDCLPDTEIPSPFKAEGESESWPIKYIPKRHIDYAVRDFLFASLFRDERARKFNKQCKNPPDYILDLVNGVDQRDQQTAIRFRILQQLHFKWLDRLHNDPTLSLGGVPNAESFIGKLWYCRPCGVMAKRTDQTFHTTCRQINFCPWCQARAAVRAFNKVAYGLLSDPANKYIVLGTDSFLFDPAAGNHDYMAGVNSLNRKLQYHAESVLKARGGLLVHQMSPRRSPNAIGSGYYESTQTVQHRCSVLGVVYINDLFSKEDLVERIRTDCSTSSWIAGPADNINTLRYLVFGSRWNPHTTSTDTFTASTNYSLVNGISGAFRLTPTFLWNDGWTSRLYGTSSKRKLVSPWGTLRKHKVKLGTKRRLCDIRKETALVRRMEMVPKVKPIWRAVQRESGSLLIGGSGRPAIRIEFTNRLKDKLGRAVSTRDITWLITYMKENKRLFPKANEYFYQLGKIRKIKPVLNKITDKIVI